MKVSTLSILIFAVVGCLSVQAQTLDTLVDVGGYKLHFVIYEGKGIPILFEAGGGEDATTWDKIIRPIAERTATTVIMYDRAGFGKSSFDPARHGILNGIMGLEAGLKKLGYGGNIMLVAHSQGGLYAQLYASRHPDKVKAAVLIDVTTTCFYDEKRLAATQQMIDRQNTDKLKLSHPGSYYQGADFSNIQPDRHPGVRLRALYIQRQSSAGDQCDCQSLHSKSALMAASENGTRDVRFRYNYLAFVFCF